MVALRLIPCLDVAHGRVVKGVNFVNLRDSGDPVELACRYSDEGADELVFLDIRASVENRNTLVDLVSRTAKSVKIPFTVGGGIDSVSSICVKNGISTSNAGAIKMETIQEQGEQRRVKQLWIIDKKVCVTPGVNGEFITLLPRR